jgi:hypothetical protein
MTVVDTLVPGTNATHDVLAHRLSDAAATRPDATHARDQFPATDTFLASASRHNAAVCAVIVPAVRSRVPDGDARAREFLEQSKRLEVALAQVKAKLYGSTYAIRRSWESVWDDVRLEFEASWQLERVLVMDLAAHRRPDDPDWGVELYHGELHAPTRPHPYVPHQGISGAMARKVAVRVDKFWDATEGRMVPEPVHPHDRSHDGKFAQYFLADPHLPDDEEE